MIALSSTIYVRSCQIIAFYNCMYVHMYLLHVYYFLEDKVSHYSIIVLGVCTLSMSVLLWWLYKKLARHFSGKDKYDLEGNTRLHYMYLCSYNVYVFMYVRMYVYMYNIVYV